MLPGSSEFLIIEIRRRLPLKIIETEIELTQKLVSKAKTTDHVKLIDCRPLVDTIQDINPM